MKISILHCSIKYQSFDKLRTKMLGKLSFGIASQASPDRNDNAVRGFTPHHLISNKRNKDCLVKSALFGRTSGAGFTLMELLIVMAVMVSVLVIVVGITSSTLRGSNKTSTINNVRENGNYAISQMARVIRYAKSFDGVSEDGVTNWTCDVVLPPPAPTPVPIKYKSVRITSFDGGVTVFSCNDSVDTPPETIVSNSESLIDTTSVALSTPIPTFCFFTCRQERTTDSPTIGINFTLNAKTTNVLVEHRASIPFAVSVKTRN